MEVRLKDHLCFRLYVASRLIIQAYGEHLQPLGITYPKYLVLLALLEEDRQTVGSLGALLSLDSGTLSPLLKSMAARGYVKRERLSEDERTVVNTITPAGRSLCTHGKKIAVALFKQTGMTEAQLSSLRGDMDDYVGRCIRILGRKRLAPTHQPKKKESPWKRKSRIEPSSPPRLQ